KAGLTPFEIGVMSVFVFAGSAQFTAVSMISGHAGLVPIILTTFMVNLRHVLMSSSLALYLGRISSAKLSLFAYGITDETFAVNLSKFHKGHWGFYRSLAVNQIANMAWVISTVIGGYSGQFIPAGAFGMDYAMIAMFISLLVIQIRGRIYLVTAIISGGLAVMLSLMMPGNSYIMVASIISAALGALIKNRSCRTC
ncbi:MAG: AzlC family ABC transporter permease, partial [Desulfobacterales bacterium]|nr:AzlC family ABC transporter permease [Desulfobacterales bacterium]